LTIIGSDSTSGAGGRETVVLPPVTRGHCHRTNIGDIVERARAETAGVQASSETRQKIAAEAMSRTKGTEEGSVLVVANPAIRSAG
jgi:hypothetical protein